jgi:hypothetical protein
MTLVLHRGAELISPDTLRGIVTPERTESHVPLPHHELVNMAKYALGYYGHEVTSELHGVTPDGMEYFGLLTLKSDYGDYTDTCGLRNSHSKRFPIGLAYGAVCFVCDNLSFQGTHVIRRKHTANSHRDLPGLVAEVVAPLQGQRQEQYLTFQRYKEATLSDNVADQTIMRLYREEVIGVQRIADVLRQWETPEYDWGGKTAFRLFNAATFTLAGKVSETPDLTKRLHQVIDRVCETVH